MEKAKVYFSDFRTKAFGDGLPTKLKKLIKNTLASGAIKKVAYSTNAGVLSSQGACVGLIAVIVDQLSFQLRGQDCTHILRTPTHMHSCTFFWHGDAIILSNHQNIADRRTYLT